MAYDASTHWDVRPGSGSANNGGGFAALGGIDRSQQALAAIAWLSAGGTYTNDLAATNASPSVLTSTSYSFTTGSDAGNIINLIAGTNIVPGPYQIVSCAGGAATLQANCCSGGAGSGGSGYLGGALDSFDTLAQITLTAGNAVWIKGGSDSITAARTLQNGSLVAPIRYNGYDTTRGDLTTGGARDSTHLANGFLDTTAFPTLALAANVLTVGTFSRFAGLNITMAKNAACLSVGTSGWTAFHRCKLANTTAGGGCITGGAGRFHLSDCDVSAVAAAGTYALAFTTATAVSLHGVRLTSTAGGGLSFNVNATAAQCLFYNMAAGEIAMKCNLANAIITLDGNTCDRVLGTVLTLPPAPQTNPILVVRNNHVTNCGTFVDNLRSDTQILPIVAYNNRIRNCTADYVGFAVAALDDITTADTDAHEYADQATADFRPLLGSFGRGAGLPAYLDTGCFQRKETLHRPLVL